MKHPSRALAVTLLVGGLTLGAPALAHAAAPTPTVTVTVTETPTAPEASPGPAPAVTYVEAAPTEEDSEDSSLGESVLLGLVFGVLLAAIIWVFAQ